MPPTTPPAIAPAFEPPPPALGDGVGVGESVGVSPTVERGLSGPMHVSLPVNWTVIGGELPPVPYRPALLIKRMKRVPESMLTVQLAETSLGSCGTGMSHALPPGTKPCRPNGYVMFSVFQATRIGLHCPGRSTGSVQKPKSSSALVLRHDGSCEIWTPES
jgi:hypothetical protein